MTTEKCTACQNYQHVQGEKLCAATNKVAQRLAKKHKSSTEPDAELTRAHVQMIHDTALHALADIPEAHWSYDPIWLIASSTAMILRRLGEG